MVYRLVLLYLPLTKGTIQKEHILLHPRMIDKNAVTLPVLRTGLISAYVY